MKVKLKKLHPDAVVPVYAIKGDAGLDLTAVSKEYDDTGSIVYSTGIALEIPFGYAGFVFPRSSISKQDLALANSVGVIDSNYRGEIKLKFKPTACFADQNEKSHKDFKNTADFIAVPQLFDAKESIYIETCEATTGYFINHEQYNVGDRIAQIIIMPFPEIEFVEVDSLDSSDRGTGGFGSTGK